MRLVITILVALVVVAFLSAAAKASFVSKLQIKNMIGVNP